jgi:threonylcarbamoyladenosine tRNA methylthiotransferase MtaB
MMSRTLTQRGHTQVGEADLPDAIIINTCAVTSVAEKKSRALIRRMRTKYPIALICVCGCYPAIEAHPDDLNVDLWGDAQHIKSFLEALEESGQRFSSDPAPAHPEPERARAYLKIQDGCDNACSYCVIGKARGPSRSEPIEDLLTQAKGLHDRGFRELVLTGIEISSYQPSLLTLIERLGKELPDVRIRLGSLDPSFLTRENVEKLHTYTNVCPHFHVSLQSGCDSVLRRMNRRYTTMQYEQKIDWLRLFYHEPAITTDLIAGFPGESLLEWQKTLAFIEKIGFSRMHIFPFSRRPGTPADTMPEQLSKTDKQRRCAEATEVASHLARSFLKRQEESFKHVLVETSEDGVCFGHSEDYLECRYAGTDARGSLTRVRVLRSDGAILWCKSAPEN